MKLFHLKKTKGERILLCLLLKNELELKMILRNTSINYLLNAAFRKFSENVRNRLRLEIIKKDGIKNFNKQ